ncbi:MAG: class I SAM-dependent methyltransferase [Atribacterota bacterium]
MGSNILYQKIRKYLEHRDSFYRCEGKLATIPIIKFIEKHNNRCYGKLVDVGCGSKPYKEYFSCIEKYIGIDITNTAEIIADAKLLPIKSNSVDCVLCNQLIEHDPEPSKIFVEIYRILKKGGILILSAPQMGRLHGEPHDYYRYTKWGLKYLLEKNSMEIELIEPHGGFFRAIGSHLNFFLLDYFGKNKYIRYLIKHTIILFNNFIFTVLEKTIDWKKDTLGYNIIAKKK